MKRQALFIGINNYKHGIQPLSCAKRDAEELRLLFDRAGFKTDIMTNEEASGSEEIRKKVREITSGLGPDDLFLFYFSGHGVYVSGRQLLLGADASYDDCEKWRSSGGRGTPVGTVALDDIAYDTDKSFDHVFILDMCRTPLRDGQKGVVPGLAVRDLSLRNPGVGRKANFTYLFSCDTGQPALEIRDAKRGLFSLAFSSVLEDRLENQRRLLLDDAFVGTMESEMRHVAQQYEMNSCGQRPHRDPHGDTIVLFDPALLSVVQGTPTLVECPVCYANVPKVGTHNCKKCGRPNVCGNCWDAVRKCCTDCAAKAKAAEEAAITKERAEAEARRRAAEKARIAKERAEAATRQKAREEAKARREAERERQRASYEAGRREEEVGQTLRNVEKTGHGVFERQYDNGGVVPGQFAGGTIVKNGRSVYRGDPIRSGKMGQGVWEADNGSRYEGGFLFDVEWGPSPGYYEGYGVLTEPDGTRYEGEWHYSKKHGRGRLTYPNGDYYDGNWVYDAFSGHGVFQWNAGDRYEGEFKKGKRNGHGIYTWSNGDVFEGEWKNGKRNGRGRLCFANGTVRDGIWKDDSYTRQ